MHTVIAIDIGVRNISLCVYDQMLSMITFWENMPLMYGRYVNVEYGRTRMSSTCTSSSRSTASCLRMRTRL